MNVILQHPDSWNDETLNIDYFLVVDNINNHNAANQHHNAANQQHDAANPQNNAANPQNNGMVDHFIINGTHVNSRINAMKLLNVYLERSIITGLIIGQLPLVNRSDIANLLVETMASHIDKFRIKWLMLMEGDKGRPMCIVQVLGAVADRLRSVLSVILKTSRREFTENAILMVFMGLYTADDVHLFKLQTSIRHRFLTFLIGLTPCLNLQKLSLSTGGGDLLAIEDEVEGMVLLLNGLPKLSTVEIGVTIHDPPRFVAQLSDTTRRRISKLSFKVEIDESEQATNFLKNALHWFPSLVELTCTAAHANDYFFPSAVRETLQNAFVQLEKREQNENATMAYMMSLVIQNFPWIDQYEKNASDGYGKLKTTVFTAITMAFEQQMPNIPVHLWSLNLRRNYDGLVKVSVNVRLMDCENTSKVTVTKTHIQKAIQRGFSGTLQNGIRVDPKTVYVNPKIADPKKCDLRMNIKCTSNRGFLQELMYNYIPVVMKGNTYVCSADGYVIIVSL